MNLISNTTLLALTMLISITCFSQDKRPSKEKIKTMKVGYITEKVNLTSEEAQKFWPIYNEFDDKMEAIHIEIRKMHKQNNSIDDMTDSEVEKLLDKHTELREKEMALEKEYHIKFKSVLPIKKVAKLYRADHDFKKDLLRKLSDHSKGPKHSGPPSKRH